MCLNPTQWSPTQPSLTLKDESTVRDVTSCTGFSTNSDEQDTASVLHSYSPARRQVLHATRGEHGTLLRTLCTYVDRYVLCLTAAVPLCSNSFTYACLLMY